MAVDCHLFAAVITSNHICVVIGCRYQLQAASFCDTCSNHEGRLHGERQRRQHERRRERNRHWKRRGKLICFIAMALEKHETTSFFESVWFCLGRSRKWRRNTIHDPGMAYVLVSNCACNFPHGLRFKTTCLCFEALRFFLGFVFFDNR